MLTKWFKRLKNSAFRRDERGSIKAMVAITTPILLLMTGAGVDTAELYRARINFQNAVDAGTLMAAKTLAATGSTTQASEAGREVFFGNIGNIAANMADANITFNMGSGDCTSQPIVSTATLKKRVFFAFIRAATSDLQQGQVIDGSKKATDDEKMVTLNGTAEVQCGNDTIEIALVLDNSGSMRYNGKIDTLRSAAADLVNTLHTTMGASSRVDPIKFSLVPFSSMVNVGSSNKNQSWMDTNGISSIHHEHLDWDKYSDAIKVGNVWRNSSGQALTRFTLYDQLPNISWNGCVEARPYPHHTRDTVPTSGDPDTMFVPTFAPDTPDNWSGTDDKILATVTSQATCDDFQSQYYYNRRGRLRTRSIRRCEQWTDGYYGQTHPQNLSYRPHWDDRIEYRQGAYIGTVTSTSAWVDDNPIVEEWFQNNYLQDDHNFAGYKLAATSHVLAKDNTGADGDQYERQKWPWKYFNNPTPMDVNNSRSGLPYVLGIQGGPNAFCLSQALTDLTSSKSTVVNAISTMQANGATNVQSGIAWGWRTLSPDEPFTNGRDYTVADNKKIMIVMTDGNNTAYPIDYAYSGYSKKNKSYYDAFGHSVNNRIFDGFTAISNPNHDFNTFRQAMDVHMAETCENAKAAGITIYSIAFDVPNGSSVKSLLETCASTDIGGQQLYYDADNNAELVATFQSIAEKLADLAIVK